MIGSQKQPASPAQIKAQTAQVRREWLLLDYHVVQHLTLPTTDLVAEAPDLSALERLVDHI